VGFFFLNKESVFLLWWWAVEDFTTLEPLDLKKSYHQSGPPPMRPNELCPRSRQGTKGLVVNVVVVGSFAEEEEGIGIASDVVQVKVKGGDPDAP